LRCRTSSGDGGIGDSSSLFRSSQVRNTLEGLVGYVAVDRLDIPRVDAFWVLKAQQRTA